MCSRRMVTGGLLSLLSLVAAARVSAQQPALSLRDSAEAHYRRGRELMAQDEARIPSPFGILSGITLVEDALRAVGKDHESRARAEMRRALAFDSTHEGAAAALAGLALITREGSLVREASAALARAEPGSSGAEIEEMRARVAELVPDEEAPAAARRFAERGGDPGVAALLEARALVALGKDKAGAERYLEGLGTPTAPGLDAYAEDLDLLTEAAPSEAIHRGTPAERARAVRAFWVARAASGGRTQTEVIAEHYRRVHTAIERYPRVTRRAVMASSKLALHDPSPIVDDRGLVYILHGEPDRIVTHASATCAPNETWRYVDPNGRRSIYSFAAIARANEFTLLGNPLEACGAGRKEQVDALDARADVDPSFALLADRLRFPPRTRFQMEDQLAAIAKATLDLRGQAIAGLRTTTYTVQSPNPIHLLQDVYAFRDDGGGTELVASAIVPATDLVPAASVYGVSYPLEMRLVLNDTARLLSAQADSAHTFALAAALPRGAALRITAALPGVPAGPTQYSVRVHEPGTDRVGSRGGDLSVPDFHGDTLMISDLVLAEASGRGWRRGASELGLLPGSRLPAAPVTLFYELYNVPAGSESTTQMRVAPASGGLLRGVFGRGGTLAMTFTDATQPREGVVQIQRRVDLRQLKPGGYRLEVRTTIGGRTVRRERAFTVHGEEPPPAP